MNRLPVSKKFRPPLSILEDALNLASSMWFSTQHWRFKGSFVRMVYIFHTIFYTLLIQNYYICIGKLKEQLLKYVWVDSFPAILFRNKRKHNNYYYICRIRFKYESVMIYLNQIFILLNCHSPSVSLVSSRYKAFFLRAN